MQRSLSAFVATTALCIALSSCGGDSPDLGFAPWFTDLVTDRTAYLADSLSGIGQYRRYGFTVVARYENRTTGPLYVDGCGLSPIYGIEAVGTAGRAAYDPIWACGAGGGVVVQPGATRIDTLRIAGPNIWDDRGAPVGILEGPFRLVYGVRACAEDVRCGSAPAPSNPFGVDLAR